MRRPPSEVFRGIRSRIVTALKGRVASTVRWTLAAASLNVAAGVVSARLLQPSERGLLAVLLTLAGLVAVFSSLGSNVVLRSELHRRPPSLLYDFLKLTGLLCLGVFVPVLLLCAIVSSQLVDDAFWSWQGTSALVGYGVVLFTWFQLQEGLQAVGLIRYAAKASALGSMFLACFLAAALLAIGNLDVFGVSLCYAMGMCAQAAVAALGLRGHVRRSGSTDFSIFLREGPKSLGYHFGQNLTFRLDRYLLSVLSGTHAAGLYAVSATPAELIRMPVTATGQFTMFDVARGGISFRDVTRRCRSAMLFVVPLAAVGLVAGPFLIPLVYGEAYRGAVPIFRVLLIAQVVLAPYLVFSRALAATPSRFASSLVGISGLVVLSVLSFALAPAHGAIGVAIAAVGAYAVMTGLSGWYCRRALTAGYC